MTDNDYQAALEALIQTWQRGGKLLLCGNGGSSADCGHIAGELCKGFLQPRKLPSSLIAEIGAPWAEELQGGLPAIDLTAHCALLSAIVNDLGGENLFAQQVLAMGAKGDVLLGISTSGNAENVVRALQVANALGLTTIGLTGRGGGRMADLCHILLDVDATQTYQVQQLHLPLYHRLCAEIEMRLFPTEHTRGD